MNVTNCRGCGRLFNQLSNEQLCPNCMEKMDEKFDNVYDNYQNMMSKSPIDGSDYSYMGSGFGGYFGKNGIYQ